MSHQATATNTDKNSNTVTSQCFTELGYPRRVWAVSAIHGEADRLMKIHDTIIKGLRPGDRIVYLGNYTGYGSSPVRTVEELLTFRRMVLSLPGMLCSDLVYLRGNQEEMWQKLMQLQFSPDPSSILLWMLGRGISPTLHDYGLSQHDGIIAAREGVMSLSRWTGKVRDALQQQAGHETFYAHLRRAAYTSHEDSPVLFVNSGIDPQKPLEDQGDNFWWSGGNFFDITRPYAPYRRVIRGFDPSHNGVVINCVTSSIDGGCGFGGKLVSACLTPDGEIEELVEA